MMNEKQKPILIVTATRGPKEDCLTYEHVTRSARYSDDESIYITCIENNTKPLAEVYNEALQDLQDDPTYQHVLFVHDDVIFRACPFNGALQDVLDKTDYDVSGLAGAVGIEVKKPALWHLMSSRESYRGAVAHPISDTQHYVTSFGPVPSRSLVVDGVFIAVKVSAIDDTIRFDEANPGKWHHYDMDFCLTCNKNKRTIGVIDFPILHQSPGLLSMEDKAFQLSQEWFVEKWAAGNK